MPGRDVLATCNVYQKLKHAYMLTYHYSLLRYSLKCASAVNLVHTSVDISTSNEPACRSIKKNHCMAKHGQLS